MKPEFCTHCGAGIGEFKREGEGACGTCDPEGVAANVLTFQPPTGLKSLIEHPLDGSQT